MGNTVFSAVYNATSGNQAISIISIVGGFIVAIAVALVTSITTILSKKYEYNGNLYRSIIECAYKEWEAKKDFLIRTVDNGQSKEAQIYPFPFYLLYYSLFFKLLKKRKVLPKDIERFQNEYIRASNKLFELGNPHLEKKKANSEENGKQ